jgi:hypothetical protein
MGENCKHKNCRDQCHVKSYAKPRTQIRRTPIKSKTKPFKEKEGASERNVWFLTRRLEMTGLCECGCGLSSSKREDNNYKSSIAHVLCKKNFKSIATHPDNWIELNFWNGHHTTFDNMGYEHCKRTKPLLWDIVVRKFKILYPLIHPSEQKFIPQVLLDTLSD